MHGENKNILKLQSLMFQYASSLEFLTASYVYMNIPYCLVLYKLTKTGVCVILTNITLHYTAYL
jgi:hypothetical protein